MRYLILFFLFIFIIKNSFSQNIYISDLYGKWEVEKIFENYEDISNSMDGQANRWIELFNDGTFNSDGYPFGNLSGSFSFDEDQGELSLESRSNRSGIMTWKVNFEDNNLVLTGVGKLSIYKFYLIELF